MTNLTHIENIVCDGVNKALGGLKGYGEPVTRENVYKGSTRVPLCVSVARQFCYLVMHDMYHVSYSKIAKRSEHSTRSVIAGVAKARELLFIDEIYKAIYSLIRERLGC